MVRCVSSGTANQVNASDDTKTLSKSGSSKKVVGNNSGSISNVGSDFEIRSAPAQGRSGARDSEVAAEGFLDSLRQFWVELTGLFRKGEQLSKTANTSRRLPQELFDAGLRVDRVHIYSYGFRIDILRARGDAPGTERLSVNNLYLEPKVHLPSGDRFPKGELDPGSQTLIEEAFRRDAADRKATEAHLTNELEIARAAGQLGPNDPTEAAFVEAWLAAVASFRRQTGEYEEESKLYHQAMRSYSEMQYGCYDDAIANEYLNQVDKGPPGPPSFRGPMAWEGIEPPRIVQLIVGSGALAQSTDEVVSDIASAMVRSQR